MLHWKTFIKHWRDKELQGLTIVEAVEKILFEINRGVK